MDKMNQIKKEIFASMKMMDTKLLHTCECDCSAHTALTVHHQEFDGKFLFLPEPSAKAVCLSWRVFLRQIF